jgi:long-chain acyl-CoA synthetase
MATKLAAGESAVLRPEVRVNPDTIPGVFFERAARYADRPYLTFHRDGAWSTLTWGQTATLAQRVACGLIAAGLKRGDHVALISENRVEWLYCDLGILAAGGVTVPIYPSLTPHVAQVIVRDSRARMAIASTEALASKLAGADPAPRTFLLGAEVATWVATAPAPELTAELDARLAAIDPEKIATVIYTSGTTGEPKGVPLTHRHFVEQAKGALGAFRIGPDDLILSYLPYSHILERADGVFVETMAGCSIELARGMDTLLEDIQHARPTVMLGVPRVFEKIYEAVSDQVRRQPAVRRAVFRWAIGIGATYSRGRPGPWLGLRHTIAERLVLRHLRERLTGGRLRFFISGGAPLNEKVEAFFWALGVKILQGWGLTEATSAVTSNTEELHRYRTVGVPLPGFKLRIAPDGEILVSGPCVMSGYKNKPEATADVLEDGWLKTGDMGFLDSDGFLTITDRKKDLIKTSGGKYVAPLPIESEIESDRYVKAALVVGDQRPYVVALIVPDWEALAADADVSGPPSALVENGAVRARYAAIVDRVNSGLASFETVKHFRLLPRDFSEAEGELTPTLKKKRAAIALHFEDEIADLYEAHRQ